MADEASATEASLEASADVELAFSSTSGVLGGADFRVGPPAGSA